jgi:hypothetical protein
MCLDKENVYQIWSERLKWRRILGDQESFVEQISFIMDSDLLVRDIRRL